MISFSYRYTQRGDDKTISGAAPYLSELENASEHPTVLTTVRDIARPYCTSCLIFFLFASSTRNQEVFCYHTNPLVHRPILTGKLSSDNAMSGLGYHGLAHARVRACSRACSHGRENARVHSQKRGKKTECY